jgi:hypothetical protein
MPITSEIDGAKNLTTFKVKGDLTFDMAMAIVKDFYDGDPTKHVLWDLIDTTDIQLTPGEVEEIISFKPRFNGKRAEGKTAFVAQKDIFFDLARMFEIQNDIQRASYSIMVFRNIDEAHQWIDES